MGSRTRRLLRYLLLTVCAVIVFAPIYTAIVVSIQPGAALVDFPRVLIPRTLTLEPMRDAFEHAHMARYLVNSAIVTVIIVAAQVVTSILAAYAFAFIEFPFKRLIFFVFLATLMVPAEATIVANYETIQKLNWLDSYQALVAPFLAFAFGTFLLRQAFLGVPRDLRDAAAMDGYGHWGFLRQVAVPLARPSIAALTVFSFLLSWNQYLWPLLVTNADSHRTVQIGLKALSGADVGKLNLIMAGTVIAALPIFVLLVLFQRHLVRGLTSGAVKG
jgi:sn-glycerol 3-phosphate transport system permease protein